MLYFSLNILFRCNSVAASLGVEGEGRWSSWEPNNPSVYMYGSRVADALQTGIKEGIIYGPMKKEDLPWDPKVSPG